MLAHSLATFSLALSITLPIFLVMFLGMALKRQGMLNEAVVKGANQLVYNIGLPVMLFTTSASADFSRAGDSRVAIAFGLMTLLVFAASLISTRWLVSERRDEGVVIQGAFRGNLVILGLAFCAKAYGEQGLASATLPVAMTVAGYNLLSVYVLNRSLHQHNSLKPTLVGIGKNPLIIAIAAGLVLNASNLGLPGILLDTGKYLSQMVLPLALLCIGASISAKQLTRWERPGLVALVWKLLLSPLLACAIALMLGLRGQDLAILFLLAAAPTATVSYVMAEAAGANGQLAAGIVAQTTLWSLVSVTLGLWLLQVLGLV